MVICFAASCNHQSVRNTCSFYRFPKDERQHSLWTMMARRADREPSSDARLCSCHFKDGKKENDPTIFSHSSFQRVRRKRISQDSEDEFCTDSEHEHHGGKHIKDVDSNYTGDPLTNQSQDSEDEFCTDSGHEHHGGEHIEDVDSNYIENPLTNQPSSKDAAPVNESKGETCVVFIPKTCTFQGASPVINGKPLDVAGYLKKSGLIKNTLYIMSDFLSDSQNTIPVYRPTLDIEECEKVLNAPPIKLQRKKHFLGDYKEDDLITPELKQIHKIATKQVQNQTKMISNLKRQNLTMKNRIKVLNEKIKALKKKKVSANRKSILTEAYSSLLFEDDDESDFLQSAGDSIVFQDANREAVIEEFDVEIY